MKYSTFFQLRGPNAWISVLASVACFSFGATHSMVNADVVTVEITNNAGMGGVHLSPLWMGFHNGSFDTYNGGTAASVQLSRLAEDGNANPIWQTFANDQTLVGTGKSQIGDRVQGIFEGFGGAIAPGESVSMEFDIESHMGGANQFLSFASMVLPSSDYFVANGDPTAFDLSCLEDGSSISFFSSGMVDAGTEVNDFATSAGNGLYPQLDLPVGQSGPNEGTDQYGVAANVLSPFAGFLNAPADADTDPDFAALTSSGGGLRLGGMLNITVSRSSSLPEPSSIGLLSVILSGLLIRRTRI